MQLFFRQGIVRYQTDVNAQPTFLQRSSPGGQYVDLIVSPDPTVIAFAHFNANYVVEEARTVRNAWGPFTTTQTFYLYWDINVLTGELTRGFTLHPPIYSGASPQAPVADQHWFDTIATCMKVWSPTSGGKWVEKIRVFAGVYVSSNFISPLALGSQAGINGSFEGGNILLDTFFKPLRQSDGSFVTTTDDLTVVSVASKKVKFETEVLNLMALENIPKFTCVQTRPGRRMVAAHSTDKMSRVAGIAMEDVHQGEVTPVVSAGLIRAENWNWATPTVNRPVFCGADGELTTVPPTQGVLQQVGFIYDTDAVYVNIFPSLMLDHPDSDPPPDPGPTPNAPVADFSVVPFIVTGQAPFTVNFHDTSSNTPTSWEWDFDGGGTVQSTQQHPQHTYGTAGVYNVRLKATNAFGSGTLVKPSYITVTAPPPSGTFTNLDIRFEINGIPDTDVNHVKRATPFQVKIIVRNDGLLTATNVQRTFIVHDVNGQHQVVPSNLPLGAVVTRPPGAKYTKITFALIPGMVSGSMVDNAVFTLLAPPAARPINMEGAVSSPEVDSTLSNNTRSLQLQVKA